MRAMDECASPGARLPSAEHRSWRAAWGCLLIVVSVVAPTPPLFGQDAVAAGEQLFTGAMPFRNGGPACATCHSISGIRFPNGGTMGPDLTRSYAKLGELGIDATLQTLFFPTMMPIFDAHPLTPDEQRDLKAFFQQAHTRAPAADLTWAFLLLAVAGCVALLLLASLLWRRRLRGVRRALVAAAAGRSRIAP